MCDNYFLVIAEMASRLWSPSLVYVSITGCSWWLSHHQPCISFQLSSLPDLIPALTAAEQRAAASLKWRTHEKLLQKYACLPHIISSDQIYYRFLQRMFTIMMTNVSPPFPLIVLIILIGDNFVIIKFFTFLRYTNLGSCQLGRKGSMPAGLREESSLLCFLDLPFDLLPLAAGKYDHTFCPLSEEYG